MTDNLTLIKADLPDPSLEATLMRFGPARSCHWCSHQGTCEDVGKVAECGKFNWSRSRALYAQAGRALVEGERFFVITRGALFMWGYQYLRPLIKTEDGEPLEGIHAWVEYSSREWGCSIPSVYKALAVAEAYATIEVPEEMGHTQLYELKSGLAANEQLQQVVRIVNGQGLNLRDVRILKKLRRAGLVTDWYMPKLWTDGDTLWCSRNGSIIQVAKLNTATDAKLLQTAMMLLSEGVQVEFREGKGQ